MALDDRRRIAHLLRRTGFGATPEDIKEYQAIGFDAGVDRLLHPEQVNEGDVELPVDQLTVDPGNPILIEARWLHRMLYTKRPLAEKMALFWHGHFATSIEKVRSTTLMWGQYELFRNQGLGRFADLVLAVSKDPAMLIWLDNAKSNKKAPNENYGRELMELFTLGVGNYAETDVKAASRAFTGWSLQITNPDGANRPGKRDKSQPITKAERQRQQEFRKTRSAEFLFNEQWHDDGVKTLLGQTGPWNGDDAVQIIVAQPACARFISRKLFAFFVWDKPDDQTVAPFAKVFTDSQGDIRQVMEAILRSPEFSSDRAYRTKVASPVEMTATTMRLLGVGFVKQKLFKQILQMGQALFAPPTVGGWPSGLAWVGPSSMLDRYNLVNTLLSGKPQGPFADLSRPFDPTAFLGNASVETPDKLVDHVVDRLLVGDIDPDQRLALIEYLSLDDAGKPGRYDPQGRNFNAKLRGLIRLTTAVPAYHLA